jgi:serine phosphatase RsbU (regulator of sigma subunit)
MAMKANVKILLLEDEMADAEMIKRELKTSGMQFNMQVVDNRENFIKGLKEFVPDIILSDHSLSSFNSLEAFSIVKKDFSNIPFIIVTGAASEEFAVICMKAGVRDYILKKNLKRLPSAIQSVFENISIGDKEKIKALEQQLRYAFHEIEDKNHVITDSYVFAKKLQDSMLPEKQKLSKYFTEWFILNQPRDVVSGDFYWFHKVEDRLIIAIGDCTGHGVPGALMSLVGLELLNQIVIEKNVLRPSEILRNLNVNLSRFIKPDNTFAGIDIAVCSINLTNRFIEFSGASRPVWILRSLRLDKIEGSRLQVGGLVVSEAKVFESHYFQATPGDTLYFFTDGILDQPGGFKNKKLLKKKFAGLLSSIGGIQLQDQKMILKKFINEWKGNNEQIDDILVAGFKF